ncbi:MAG: zinc ribbon domain-containing protein [Chitinivibrionales bacterium]|nr:zinc ribbon domain-containing protein [Chitinivibrionales bacterium]
MPMYEFLCPDCNTIFTFFSRTMTTSKRPLCPRCKRDTLSRQVSRFATVSSKNSTEPTDASDALPIDESKMEQAMQVLAHDAEKINEEDPRQAARLMQKFSQLTGLKYNDTIQEAISRLESGDDPAQLEQQMSEALDDQEPFIMDTRKNSQAHRGQPNRDDTLYEM